MIYSPPPPRSESSSQADKTYSLPPAPPAYSLLSAPSPPSMLPETSSSLEISRHPRQLPPPAELSFFAPRPAPPRPAEVSSFTPPMLARLASQEVCRFLPGHRAADLQENFLSRQETPRMARLVTLSCPLVRGRSTLVVILF